MRSALLRGLVLMCCLTVPGCMWQVEAAENNLCFGVKLGPTFSDLDISFSSGGIDIHRDVETDTRVGLSGGVFLSLALSKWFAVQPEILYSLKGQEDKEDPNNPGIKLHYIEVPLLAKLTIPTETIVTPNFYLGPALSFNVDAKLKGPTHSIDIDDYVNTVDVGWVFGGGLDFALGNLKLTLDARYTMGLTNIGDLPGELYALFPKGSEIDFKNRAISLMVGLGF